MPGLVGFVGDFGKHKAEELLADMARAMKHKDWYQVDLHIDEGFGLGRATTGLLNPEPQPIWNEDRSICIVMEGEIFDYQDLKQRLVNCGHLFRVNNDAEFVLHLFEEFGEEFASYLNGAFVAAIWDYKAKKLVLVNDRLGLRPLYYAWYQGCFTFASGIRALLADPALPRNVDAVAIAQLLSFEYVLGNRTLLSEVQLLPPASLLTFREGHYTIRPYWKLQFAEVYQLRSREEYLEGLIYHLRQAVARQMPGDLPAGLNLSGGHDSRMLLGLLCEGQIKIPLRTFTFGIPGCDDVRIAQELAAVAGTRHHYFELKPDYLLELAEEGVRLIDGMESCVHMHALANVKAQSEDVRIIYTGYLIDSLISRRLQREWLAKYDDDTVYHLLFDDISVLFRNTNKDGFFTEDFHSQINGAFDDSFRAVAAEAKAASIADWQNQLYLLHKQRRFTENGNELLRGHVVCRTPFCDNDLVEFALSIPPGLRLDRFLFKEAIARCFHHLAKVPLDKTGLPLVPCVRELYLRADQQARWRLRSFGLGWVPVRTRRPYANYNTWMRTALRGWIEEILLSRRALERGYFNPSFIHNLVTNHMAGENLSRELGMLLSLELWHRLFLD